MSKLVLFFAAAFLGFWSCSGESAKTAEVPVEAPRTNLQIPQIVTQEQILVRIHSVPYTYWESKTNSREKLTVRSNQLPFPEITVTNWTALTNFEYSTNTYERTLTQQVRLAPVYTSNRMTQTNWSTNKETEAVYNFYFTGPDTKRYQVTNWIRVYTNFPVTNQVVLTTNWLVETNFSVETNTRLVRVVLSNKPRYTTEILVTTNYVLDSNRIESVSAKTNWYRSAEVRTNWVQVEVILPKPPAVATVDKKPFYLFPLALLIAFVAGLLGWMLARRFHKPKPVALPPLLTYTTPSRSLPPPAEVVEAPESPKTISQKNAGKRKTASKKASNKKANSELKRWDAAMSKVARSLPKKKYQI